MLEVMALFWGKVESLGHGRLLREDALPRAELRGPKGVTQRLDPCIQIDEGVDCHSCLCEQGVGQVPGLRAHGSALVCEQNLHLPFVGGVAPADDVPGMLEALHQRGDCDHMIPAAAQRRMAARAGATVVETAGSHAVYVSNPQVVADLIEQAAQGASQ